MHNQKKDNNKFKNTKQPELTENRTVWKSNNQGVKEETFIQTGRRGGNEQLGGEDLRQCSCWRTVAAGVPGEVVDCGLGSPTFQCGWTWRVGTTGEWDRLSNLGFQHGEIKPQSL